jgi:hypothetical protein
MDQACRGHVHQAQDRLRRTYGFLDRVSRNRFTASTLEAQNRTPVYRVRDMDDPSATRGTNPDPEARNSCATRGSVSPSARLRLRFGQYQRSCNINCLRRMVQKVICVFVGRVPRICRLPNQDLSEREWGRVATVAACHSARPQTNFNAQSSPGPSHLLVPATSSMGLSGNVLFQ